jgi:CBS domain-containing protein
MAPLQRKLPSKVADIMTSDVIAVHPEDNMRTIRDGMRAFGLRHIPVVDGDTLVGLLSHRDMLRFADSEYRQTRLEHALDARRTEETFVAQVMTKDVQTVRPETTIADAARKLVRGKFGCLPVTTASGQLVGIVTEHDLLEVLAAEA